MLGRRSAMYGDINDLFVPSYTAVWRTIGAGHLPVWTPAVFGGNSILGAGQFGVFYPLNALFGVFSAVTAFRWWLLLHIWIGTAGSFAWSKARFGSACGAAVTAIAYSGSGFVVLHLVHSPMLVGAAWLPFAFRGIDSIRQRWSFGGAALASLPLALIALIGHPQTLWIALTGVAVYVLVLAVNGRFRAAELWAAGRAAGAIAIALGIGAIQLLPMWEYSRTSQRPSLSMARAFELSALPHHLLLLPFPWLFGGSTFGTAFTAAWRGGDAQHEVGMFAGATILALALVAVIRRRGDRFVQALGVMALFALLLALGGSTPLGHVFYEALPLAKSFRGWARASLLVNLALAMLAGAGVREAQRAPQRVLLTLTIAAAALALVAVMVPYVGQLHQYLARGTYSVVARRLPVLLVLGLVAAVAAMVRHPRLGAGALVVVCSFEILSFVYPAEWRSQSAPIHDLRAFYDESVPPSFGRTYDAPGGIDRWLTDTYGFRLVSLAKNLHGVNGYDPLIQKEWSDTAAGMTYDAYPTRPDFWQAGWLADVLRVTTLVLDEKKQPSDPSWRPVAAVPGYSMVRWERDPRLPEAYLVGGVRVVSLGEIRKRLVDPTSPMLTTAYTEHRPPGAGLDAPGLAGRVLSADALGSGRVVVDAERPALLVLSHSWQQGWRATVDGRSAAVLRTNGLVLGVPVPAGRHTVRIGFHPPGLVPGTLVAALALVALVGSAPVARRLRRRHSPAVAGFS